MSNDSPDHGSTIAAFFASRRRMGTNGDEREQIIAALETAIAGVWRRAEKPLGAVLLGAVADRVLHEAQQRHPFFGDSRVGDGGFAFDGLRGGATSVSVDELEGGARALVLRLLIVIGNLTGDVLTPALHRELARLTVSATPPGESDAS